MLSLTSYSWQNRAQDREEPVSAQLLYVRASPNTAHPKALTLLVNVMTEPLSMTREDSWSVGTMSEVCRKPPDSYSTFKSWLPCHFQLSSTSLQSGQSLLVILT